MTCHRALEWIIDDLVVGLSPDDRKQFDEHLVSCESCTALARQYRQMWADLPAAAVLRDPNDGWNALQARIAGELAGGGGKQRAARSRGVSWTALFQRAAVVTLLVGVGVVAGMRIGGRNGGESTGPAPDSAQVATDAAMPQFVLLFYEIPGDTALQARASNAIDTWARAQFREGVVVNGAGLADGPAWAGASPGAVAGGPRLTHYIRIRATDLEHAQSVAASAPVAAYGGVIEVRAVGR